jgi:hypothetical protein
MLHTDDESSDERREDRPLLDNTLKRRNKAVVTNPLDEPIPMLETHVEREWMKQLTDGRATVARLSTGELVFMRSDIEPLAEKEARPHKPYVCELPLHVQNRWFLLIYLPQLLMFGATYATLWASNHYGITDRILARYPLINLMFVGLALGLIAFAYTRVLDKLSKIHQVFALVILVIVTSVLACGLTAYYNKQELLLTTLPMVLSLLAWFFLSCLQPWFHAFNRVFCFLSGMLILFIIGFCTLYWPYRDFWAHPIEAWDNHPENIVDDVYSMILSVVILVAILWSMSGQTKQLHYDQYLYAASQLYLDIMFAAYMVMRSNYSKLRSHDEPRNDSDTPTTAVLGSIGGSSLTGLSRMKQVMTFL